jgi:general secretion pathway protein K
MTSSARRHPRGFALLVVLWTLGLLALLVVQLASSGRTEAQIADNLRRNAQAEALADGAVHQAIFQLVNAKASGWAADGMAHDVVLPGGRASIVLRNEADRISLNTAPVDLLRALMQVLGADERSATNLAGTIDLWRGAGGPEVTALVQSAGLPYRPSGTGFETPADLATVPGMSPALLRLLLPHLTCFTESGPRTGTQDPVVATAMALIHQNDVADQGDDNPVVDITATVRGATGGIFVRRAVVALDASNAAHPFEILDWGEGADAAVPAAGTS